MGEVNAHNMAYWIANPMGPEELYVLKTVKSGGEFGSYRQRKKYQFYIAFLIAEECLDWNEDTGALSITEKGEDALDFFKED